MTQEQLAEKMNVSRQTVSKWESGTAYPEVDKIVELCKLFSCSMDRLIRENMSLIDGAYSSIKVVTLEAFKYVRYTVISKDPEGDSINNIEAWAKKNNITNPQIIGWDFPFISQEQINIYHMHGYTAACIIPEGEEHKCNEEEIMSKEKSQYAVIAIKEPFKAPFQLIPNAYKTIMSYMEINGLRHREESNVLPCFEKKYLKDDVYYMYVYIAVQ